MDIIERAARALAKRNTGYEQNWPTWASDARAVLSALREPILEIVDRHGGNYEQSDYAAGMDAAQSKIYTDIDEALKG